MLIAALSGRALAAAARRAGARSIVLDLFADLDKAALAERCVRLPPGPDGFDRACVLAAVASLGARASGLVYGAGFEHDPSLLGEFARRVPLIGNPPEVVAVVKDPFGLAALLARLGLPHPEVRRAAPAERGWLRKTQGASGGAHVVPAAPGAAAPRRYVQRRVPGASLSAFFLGDGRRARLLGVTEQWADPTADAPFRYGGCAGPLPVPAALAAALSRALDAIVAATGLVGLNSLDLLVTGDAFHVIELNPRPGATLDVFDDLPLWQWHCEAVAGRLPASCLLHRGARAAAIFYAPARLTVPAAWPGWAADLSPAGTVIDPDEPVCTIRAAAATLSAARAEVGRRADALRRRFSERVT